MSKERDLLQRAKILLDCVCTSPVQKEIEELLAQPEPEQTEQEPVAWMYDWKIPTGEVQHVFASKNHLTTDLRCVSNEVENVRPLYLAPSSEPEQEPRKPLNIADVENHLLLCDVDEGYIDGYIDGMVYAEREHKIRGHNE